MNFIAHRSTRLPFASLLAASLVLVLASSLACSPATRFVAPDKFVQLEDDQLGYEIAQKAVSSDGAVILLRERDNEPEGTLDFWGEALKNELTDGRGYELIETTEVQASPGFAGTLYKLKGTHNDLVYRYDVAIFVRGDLIITVETAAPEDEFEAHAAEFDAAVRSVGYN